MHFGVVVGEVGCRGDFLHQVDYREDLAGGEKKWEEKRALIARESWVVSSACFGWLSCDSGRKKVLI